MKLWLSGLALLTVATTAQAENFRIVQSPAQKLDIWIDNIKDNTPQSWCKADVALRIVANDTTLLHTLSDAAQFLPCGTD